MTLEGKGLCLFVITVALLIISVIIVFLRIIVRLKIKGFGLDDYLMSAAQIFFIGTCIAVILGCYSGIGIRDSGLTAWDQSSVRHAVVTFQCFYCVTLIFVKTSICCALLRIAISRPIIFFLYAIIFLSVSSALVTLITVLTQCKPIKATWDRTAGRCTSPIVIIDVSYFVSACSLATDFSCSILPFYMLWSLQMKWALKLTISAILGLGLLASSATIVRFFYFDSYTAKSDYAYLVSDIVIWSILETGIGISAGSAPALRPLLRSIPFFSSSANSSKKASHTELERGKSPSFLALVTIGGHVSARCSRAHFRDDSERMKGIMDDRRVMISSEIMMENRPRH